MTALEQGVSLAPEDADVYDWRPDPDELARWRALSRAQEERELRDAGRVIFEPWPFTWTPPGPVPGPQDPGSLRYF